MQNHFFRHQLTMSIHVNNVIEVKSKEVIYHKSDSGHFLALPANLYYLDYTKMPSIVSKWDQIPCRNEKRIHKSSASSQMKHEIFDLLLCLSNTPTSFFAWCTRLLLPLLISSLHTTTLLLLFLSLCPGMLLSFLLSLSCVLNWTFFSKF